MNTINLAHSSRFTNQNYKTNTAKELKISFQKNDFIDNLSKSSTISELSNTALQREPKYLEVDKKFQARVQDYVNQGVITPDTLVLDDTGHGVGNLLQTLRNPTLNAQGTVYIPESISKQSKKRISSQLTEFGDEIQILQEKNKASGSKGAAFVGLEIHRIGYYDLDPAKLPAPEYLKNNGIDKVVVLDEVYPPAKLPGIDYVAEDLQGYLRELEKEGLQIDCRGIDPRKENTQRTLTSWMPASRAKNVLKGENNAKH